MYLVPATAFFAKLFFLLLFLGCAESAIAQTSTEPLGFAQRLVFPASTAWSGRPDEQYQVDITRFRLRWPVFLDGKRTILLPGASYEHIDIGLRGSASVVGQSLSRPREVSLHAPMAEVALVQQMGGRWITYGTLLGGMASDFAGSYSHDDLAFIARFIALYRADDKLTIGLGVSYDRGTGNLSFVPLGIVKWAPSSRWLVTTLLPKVALVSYHTSSWLSSSVRAEMDYSRYHLDESRYGKQHLYLRYVGVMFGPALTVSPNPFVHVDFFTGCALRWVGTYVQEGPLGLDVYFNTPDPVHAVALSPSAFFSARLWLGLEGWTKE